MKTTYPYRWKANRKDDNQIIEGKTLTTIGRKRFGISQRGAVDLTLCACGSSAFFADPLCGVEIKPDTLYWQCYKCKDWNHRKEIFCKCGAILGKFKEDIING